MDEEIKKIKIYTYHFPDGKIYIGYTTGDLKFRHNQHKRIRHVSPITKYLNNPETEVNPKYETTVTLDLYDNDNKLYKIQRKILDTYTTDTNQILHRNLYLFGY